MSNEIIKNPAEELQKGIDKVIQKSEQIDKVADKVETIEKSVSEAIKSMSDVMKSMSDFQIEQVKKAEEKAMKKHSRSEVYKGIESVGQQENKLLDNTVEELKKSFEFASSTKKDEFLAANASADLASGVLKNMIKSSAPAYSTDVNSLGGFAIIPQVLPTTEITPYTNEGLLVDLIGMTMIESNKPAFRNRIDYDFNSQVEEYKQYAEGSEYTYNNNAMPIYKPMNVDLHAVKKQIQITLKQFDNDPALYNFLLRDLSNLFKIGVARSVVSKISQFKSIKSMPTEVSEVLNAHIVQTATAGSVELVDFSDKIFSPDTLLLENFQRPVYILNSKLLNSLYQKETAFGYPRDARIDTTRKTIKTAHGGDIPYVTINNSQLLASTTTGLTSGKVAGILMDTFDAYELLGTSMGARTTINHPHNQNQSEMLQVLQTIYVGGAVKNPYKISILEVQ